MADEKDNKEKMSDKQPTQAETYQKSSASAGEYREANMEYMRGAYPDMELNDENYDEMLNKTVHEFLVPKLKGYEENNTKIKAMMEAEPQLAQILADMARGARFEQVLPRYVDVPNLKLEPGDPDYTEWEANNKYRMDNYQQGLDRKTQLENNQRKSQEVIASWFEEKQMKDDDKKEFGMYVADLLDRAYSGEITQEFLNKMYYAMNYEKDIASAEDAGRVAGRNEKIVEGKMKEDKQKTGDGMPVTSGGASKEKETKPDNRNDFEKGLSRMVTKQPIIKGNGY